jgi:hypothetical protein
MHRLSTRQFPSFRLFLGHKTAGEKPWHQQSNFPELGLGFYYSPLMFDDQLGQAYAVFGYFDRKFGKKERNNFHFRFGLGPGFLSAKFDPKENNQNIAIGTNLNIFVFFELQKDFKISEAIDLKAGIGMAHFSNTGVKMPNLGINLASVQLGLKYRIGSQEIKLVEQIEPEYKTWNHEVLLSFGRRQSEVGKALSTIINPRYQLLYSLSFKSKLIACADLFFDIADNYSYPFEQVDDEFQAGIAAGYVLNMEQIQFTLQWGFYLYNQNPDFYAYYHRLGVKWIASEHILVNLSLRTEWARARNVELGVGWRF